MEEINKPRVLVEIEKDMEIFRQTEGWEHFSSTQQKLIKASLIISERAKRGVAEELSLEDDPLIHEARRLLGEHVISESEYDLRTEDAVREAYKHRRTKKHIDSYYCNIAVYVLEGIDYLRREKRWAGTVPAELPRLLPGGAFFKGEKADLSNKESSDAVFSDNFPYICHVLHPDDEPGSGSIHSFVVLGRNGGDLVVWEKVERRAPYKRSTLSEIFEEYPHDTFRFYVRPMKRGRELDV